MGAIFHLARLHKTAGGSFRRHLRELFPPEEICPHTFEFELNGDTELDRYTFFDGHISLPGLASRIVPDHVILLVREPAERIQSAYWFWRDLAAKAKNRDHPLLQLAGRLTLLEFVTSANPLIRDSIWNAQTRFIAGGRFGDSNHTRTCVIGPDLSPEALLAAARQTIDQAYFVAVTEHLAESVGTDFSEEGTQTA